MAATRVYVTQLDQGLDTNIASSMIDEKAAVDLLNVRWNEGGIVMKRDGFIDVFEALVAPKSISRYIVPTAREILAIDGTGLKKTTLASGEWSDVSGISFNAAAEIYDIPQIKDKSYIWNKVDGGAVYDGSTTSRPGTMPSAGFSVYYKGFHIAAGVPLQPSRIYISTINDTSDFTNNPSAITSGPDPDNATEVPGATVFTGSTPDVAQFVDISPSDGDSITLLREFQDYLIIGKENSLWSFTIDADSQKPVIQLITRAVGCVSQASAVPVQNDLYLLSEQGPISLGNERNYVGSLRTNLLSEKIKGIIDAINPTQWQKATAVYYDRMYIISIPYGGSSNINKVLMLDTRFGGWSVWSNIDATSWVSFQDTQNKRHLYFLKEGSTNIHEMVPGYYYDNTEAIDAYWKSKAIDAGALDVTKRWTYFTLFMRNVGASADISINTEIESLDTVDIFGDTVGVGMGFSPWGTGSWIGFAGDQTTGGEETNLSTSDDAWRTRPNLESRTFTFQVRNNKPGENFYLAGFALQYISLKAYYFDQSHEF